MLTRLCSDLIALPTASIVAILGSNLLAAAPVPGATAWLFPPLVIALLAVRGMYRSRITLSLLDGAGHIVGATSVAAMALLAFSALVGANSALPTIVVWLIATPAVATGRLTLALAQRRARSKRLIGKRTLIVGAGRVGAHVERRLELQPELGLVPVGYVDADPAPSELVRSREHPVLGAPSELAEIAAETGAEHVILTFLAARGSDAQMIPFVRRCTELGLEVSVVPRLFESINLRMEIEHIGGMPLFQLRPVDPKGWHFAVKGAFDRALAGLLLLALSPLMLALMAAVKLTSSGPLLFRQRRVGRDGQVFDMLKFRTMAGDPRQAGESDADWAALMVGAPDDLLRPESGDGNGDSPPDRRTGIGRFMRRWSLDELPQLLNVELGHMSLVGPRPERLEFVELFGESVARYDDRHRVKSGLTGWAQVHGLRGKTSLSDRVEWDNFYIENWSLKLDFKILLMTLTAVFTLSE